MGPIPPGSRTRLWPVWGRAASLAGPVVVEKGLRTLMRTTDVVVAGLLSPASVAAVGIGDSFSRIVHRMGSGIGDATMALSSQDTGAGAIENRNEVVAQALLIGVLAGVPFIAFGSLLSYRAFELLGAEQTVVRQGGQYLTLLMVAAPMIHLSRIGATALQGSGDTRTPMYVRGSTNLLNLVGTVVLALGLGPFPRLSVLGIGIATVVGESASAVLLVGALYRPGTDFRPTRPSQLVITTQIGRLSLPRIGEGVAVAVGDVPFNAVLLTIGTEANAAYHLGRRLYLQILRPVASGFGVSANILVGQAMGDDRREAYVNGLATVSLLVLVTGALSLVLYVAAPHLVRAFSSDATTVEFSTGFVRAFAVGGVLYGGSRGLRGALRGGSDTRSPFVAGLVGMFVFLLGVSYVGGVHLGYGILAVYAAIVLDFGWQLAFLGVVYHRHNWLDRGTTLMEDRGSIQG